MTHSPQVFQKIAVLIDGDNANAKQIDDIFQQINKLGKIGCQKVYGDFKQPNLASWDAIALSHLIEQVHIPAYVKQKNATDIALAVDAMDLAYQGYDCFCILSSDSDFSILAKNLRTKGKKVFGFGRETAVESFRKACDNFVVLPRLKPNSSTVAPSPKIIPPKVTAPVVDATETEKTPTIKNQTIATATNKPINSVKTVVAKSATPPPQVPKATLRQDTLSQTTTKLPINKPLIDKVIRILQENPTPKNGFTTMSYVGSQLKQQEINYKDYGYNKLRAFIESMGVFEVTQIDNHDYVRIKTPTKPIKSLAVQNTQNIAIQQLTHLNQFQQSIYQTLLKMSKHNAYVSLENLYQNTPQNHTLSKLQFLNQIKREGQSILIFRGDYVKLKTDFQIAICDTLAKINPNNHYIDFDQIFRHFPNTKFGFDEKSFHAKIRTECQQVLDIPKRSHHAKIRQS
ncbi:MULTISPECIES: NYN domain-containing protein [unclassified Moraxella]|uniref:NYN domain-containing protein n=1 Tax=unclassified Moraxella TaxID=2685852 RepID=UPI003AF637C1